MRDLALVLQETTGNNNDRTAVEKVEQPVLVLIDSDPKLVDIIPQVVDLRSSRQMPRVFKILQRASDLCPMAFDLSSNVLQRRLRSGNGPVKFEPQCDCP